MSVPKTFLKYIGWLNALIQKYAVLAVNYCLNKRKNKHKQGIDTSSFTRIEESRRFSLLVVNYSLMSFLNRSFTGQFLESTLLDFSVSPGQFHYPFEEQNFTDGLTVFLCPTLLCNAICMGESSN